MYRFALKRGEEILIFNCGAVAFLASQITNMNILLSGGIPIVNIEGLPVFSKFAM
jgi:hypothetical protein